jgi:ABC-type transport system substrate-binding protein
LYALFEGYLIAEAPQVPLYHPTYVYAQNARVRGFSGGLLFTSAARFQNVRDWYVETRVRR